MPKPLLVFSASEYPDDAITVYGNKEGLQGLRRLIDQVLSDGEHEDFTVCRGKKEKHEVGVSISSHADFPSEYD